MCLHHVICIAGHISKAASCRLCYLPSITLCIQGCRTHRQKPVPPSLNMKPVTGPLRPAACLCVAAYTCCAFLDIASSYAHVEKRTCQQALLWDTTPCSWLPTKAYAGSGASLAVFLNSVNSSCRFSSMLVVSSSAATASVASMAVKAKLQESLGNLAQTARESSTAGMWCKASCKTSTMAAGCCTVMAV